MHIILSLMHLQLQSAIIEILKDDVLEQVCRFIVTKRLAYGDRMN